MSGTLQTNNLHRIVKVTLLCVRPRLYKVSQFNSARVMVGIGCGLSQKSGCGYNNGNAGSIMNKF